MVGHLARKARDAGSSPAQCYTFCLHKFTPEKIIYLISDIYVIEDEDYEEPRERQPKVQYKLKIADNPAAQNMPHEEDYSDNNYESIDETAV